MGNCKDNAEIPVNARAAKYVFDHQGLAAWGAGPGGWTEDGDAFYGTDRAEAERAARDLGLLDPVPAAPADAPPSRRSTGACRAAGSGRRGAAPCWADRRWRPRPRPALRR